MASMNYFLSKLYISGITLSAMQKVKRLEKQIILKFLGARKTKVLKRIVNIVNMIFLF